MKNENKIFFGRNFETEQLRATMIKKKKKNKKENLINHSNCSIKFGFLKYSGTLSSNRAITL